MWQRIKDLLFWRRDYRHHQEEMWKLYREGHDIGTLPGGHQIHYRICWCRKASELNRGEK